MSQVPLDKLVQLDPVDPKLQDFLGVTLYLSEDSLQVYALFSKLPNLKELSNLLKIHGIDEEINLESFSEAERIVEGVKNREPFLVVDLYPKIAPLPDIDFLDNSKTVNEYWRKLRRMGPESIPPRLPIINISKGQKLAKRISEAELEKYKTTYDVYGRKREALRKIISFKLGSGVEEHEDRTIHAVTTGYLVLRGSEVDVIDTYRISTIADWEGGRLEFIGSVEVGPKVLQNFDISAGKDIEVQGTCEGASLEAQGEIILREGIIGNQQSVVSAGRLIKARYANQAKIICEQDCEFEKGVFHSRVEAYGKLSITLGPIQGGQVYGANGIEAKTLGASSQIQTLVATGYCADFSKSLDIVIAEQKIQHDSLMQKLALLTPLFEKEKSGKMIADSERITMQKLLAEVKEIRKNILEMDFWIANHDKEKCERAKIVAKGQIFPGVIVKIHNKIYKVKEPMRMISFQYDESEDRIKAKPYRSR